MMVGCIQWSKRKGEREGKWWGFGRVGELRGVLVCVQQPVFFLFSFGSSENPPGFP